MKRGKSKPRGSSNFRPGSNPNHEGLNPMAQAKRVHSTPRKTASKIKVKKKKTPTKKSGPKKSGIIEQCVIYAQSIAAYNAGFKVDPTGHFDHAGAHALGSEYLQRAAGALGKLVGLSPAFITGKPPLSREELFAKAGVLGIMTSPGGTFSPEPETDGAVQAGRRCRIP